MRSVLLFSFLSFCFVGYGQIINFPDANFKKALVNTLCVDTNGDNIGDADADLNDDGEIDVSEANVVKSLYVSRKSIYSLVGIEKFNNLTLLVCNSNILTSLNLQGLIFLETLDCYGNQITSLDLKGLINLKYLYCHYNDLTSLDLQGLINLKNLSCYSSKLTSLDLSGLINLETIDCSYNQISSLDVQGLINLKNLNCFYNQMTSLNVGWLIQLETLNCYYNSLTSLDLQGLINLKTLHCHYNELTSLDLQGLINLETLHCFYNKLTSLNVQGLVNLKYLSCYVNRLTSLNVQGLINLETLHCGLNKLTTLDVHSLINLKILRCFNNQVTSLDIKDKINLETLACSSNQLISLNVQNLKKLRYLSFGFNQLTSVDVQGLINLKNLYCTKNQLTSLNVQGLINLEYLDCSSNQLTSLNVKTNYIDNSIASMSFSGNPNLKYICCNEERIEEIKNMAILNGQNCEVNSYCNFIPGGKFYILKGENIYDKNSNGCHDLDTNLPFTKFNITNDYISYSFISNSKGKYSIPLQKGTHTVTPEYPEHFEIKPSSFTIIFPSTSDTITQNFCITPKGIFRQTNITVIPLTPPARPGFEAKFKIVWENVGNQIESGTLNFTYYETLLDYISATQTADQVADGIVKWNFTNLFPFEKREITVTLKVNRPTDTPAVNAGDKLYLTASILDNIFTLENTVVGSYDPNDKTCLQGDRVKPDMVGEYVNYLIRFENTGNYAAENVVVKDIIDTKTFDVSTLKITDASHEVYTRIEGNKVEFIFENIQLPFDDANNDGYIAFKIKTLPTLVLGDSLKNLADIYFDYNFPIRTNEAQTTVAFPEITKDVTSEVNIYPNPVTDILYLETEDHWTKAEIYDISGRIMRSLSLDTSSIDVRELESGTYFIRLKDGDSVGLVKFVKI